jgi:membrane protein
MNRLSTWLITGLTGWLAVKSIRAQDEAALLSVDDGTRLQHGEGGNRGRTADRPRDIPARGWKDILVRTYRSVGDDRVMALAAGVTYYVLLALFPGLAALVSIYGMFANPADIERQLAGLAGTIPQEAVEIMRGQLQHLASQSQKALGFAFFGGLLVSLWSANAAVKALFDALNVVYGEKERRNFFKLNALSLLFTAGMILFLVLALIGIVVVPAALNFLQLGGAGALIISLLR